jgi:AraC-like DNA-binding protein
MLEQALFVDANGMPLQQQHRTYSQDWDEVRSFCDSVYMPYYVSPLGRFRQPRALMYSATIGRIIMTRFSYGVPIHLKDFDPQAGNILVLTSLDGAVRHGIDTKSSAVTSKGESFVADCSRTEYWLDGDERHLQLNLTIPHDLMEETALHWFGFVPSDELWTAKVKLGGLDTAWWALLNYIVKSIPVAAPSGAQDRLVAHLEQTVCVHLLRNWARQSGLDLEKAARTAAPGYVHQAERYMRENAQSVPTLVEVAQATGVSVRALSNAFRRYRNMTPYSFLREQRLQGVRQQLLESDGSASVSSIVSQWGYVNFGVFAKSYKHRFGELPSETRRCARYRTVKIG